MHSFIRTPLQKWRNPHIVHYIADECGFGKQPLSLVIKVLIFLHFRSVWSPDCRWRWTGRNLKTTHTSVRFIHFCHNISFIFLFCRTAVTMSHFNNTVCSFTIMFFYYYVPLCLNISNHYEYCWIEKREWVLRGSIRSNDWLRTGVPCSGFNRAKQHEVPCLVL